MEGGERGRVVSGCVLFSKIVGAGMGAHSSSTEREEGGALRFDVMASFKEREGGSATAGAACVMVKRFLERRSRRWMASGILINGRASE